MSASLPNQFLQSYSRDMSHRVYGKSFLLSAKDCHDLKLKLVSYQVTNFNQLEYIRTITVYGEEFLMEPLDTSIYFLLLIAADLGEI